MARGSLTNQLEPDENKYRGSTYNDTDTKAYGPDAATWLALVCSDDDR